jgi:hypothetical protein
VSRVRRAAGDVPALDHLLRSINQLTAIAEQGDNAAVAAALFDLVANPMAPLVLEVESAAPPRNGKVMSQPLPTRPLVAAPVLTDPAA